MDATFAKAPIATAAGPLVINDAVINFVPRLKCVKHHSARTNTSMTVSAAVVTIYFMKHLTGSAATAGIADSASPRQITAMIHFQTACPSEKLAPENLLKDMSNSALIVTAKAVY